MGYNKSMKNKPNILLIGKMGCGKSSLAKLLETRQEYFCIPLAKALKTEAVRLLGRDLDKKNDRRFLQLFGQACRDGIDKNYWCDIVAKEISRIYRDVPYRVPIVIDDCRFQNEVDYFKPDFITVRLLIDDYTRINRLMLRDGNISNMKELESDSSENGFDDDFKADYVIGIHENDTKEDVYSILSTLIQEVPYAIH